MERSSTIRGPVVRACRWRSPGRVAAAGALLFLLLSAGEASAHDPAGWSLFAALLVACAPDAFFQFAAALVALILALASRRNPSPRFRTWGFVLLASSVLVHAAFAAVALSLVRELDAWTIEGLLTFFSPALALGGLSILFSILLLWWNRPSRTGQAPAAPPR